MAKQFLILLFWLSVAPCNDAQPLSPAPYRPIVFTQISSHLQGLVVEGICHPVAPFSLGQVLSPHSTSAPLQKGAAVYLQIITLKTQADLDRILASLKSGQEFFDLAQKHSTHLTASNGGIWGPVRLEVLPSAVRDQIEKAEEGALVHFFDPALGHTILRKLNPDVARKVLFEQTLKRGLIHLQRKEKDQALKELKKAVALDPQSAAAHEFLGQAYLMQDTYEMLSEARAEFVQALALNPGSVWARFYLAWIYLDIGSPQKAIEQLESALQLRPNVPHLLSLLGEANRKLGNLDLSIEQNKKALTADPSFAPARYYLALAYLDVKKEDEAIRELEAAVQSGYLAPEVYRALGTAYLRKGRLEEAVGLYQKAVAAEPANAEGHLRLAQAYRLKKQPDLALMELDRAQPAGQRRLSATYYQELEAEVSFERGLIYQEKQALSQAVEAYLKVLELNPNHCQAHRQLAETLFLKREYEHAMKHAEKAEQLKCRVESSLLEKIKARQHPEGRKGRGGGEKKKGKAPRAEWLRPHRNNPAPGREMSHAGLLTLHYAPGAIILSRFGGFCTQA